MIIFWINKAIEPEDRKRVKGEDQGFINFKKGWEEVSQPESEWLLKDPATFSNKPDFNLIDSKSLPELAKTLGIKAEKGIEKEKLKKLILEQLSEDEIVQLIEKETKSGGKSK